MKRLISFIRQFFTGISSSTVDNKEKQPTQLVKKGNTKLMKYIVETSCDGTPKAVASFARRSDALDYADLHRNVSVTRKTPRTTRVVFSRSVSENKGFITVSETQTFKDRGPAAIA